MSRSDIEDILKKHKTIIAVGISRELEKDSHKVSAYPKAHGFRIIPVNPFADKVLGEKSYKNLLDITHELQKTVKVVEILRSSEDVPNFVEQAIRIKALYDKLQVVWMQLGIVNEDAAEAAKKDG